MAFKNTVVLKNTKSAKNPEGVKIEILDFNGEEKSIKALIAACKNAKVELNADVGEAIATAINMSQRNAARKRLGLVAESAPKADQPQMDI